MSQEINNREMRKNAIKDMLRQLHEGKSVEAVQEQFRAAFDGVAASEISAAEQALISEGLPVTEVQRLCDVHSSVFKGSIEEIHAPSDASKIPGHPAHTLRLENAAIQKQIDERIRPLLGRVASGALSPQALLPELGALMAVDLHYSRKENLLFPYLEQHGVTAPPKVMWGVDDEIRALLKESARLAAAGGAETADKLSQALSRVEEMIFKEENILIPMLLDTLEAEEWSSVARESGEIGYCLIDSPPAWQANTQPRTPRRANRAVRRRRAVTDGFSLRAGTQPAPQYAAGRYHVCRRGRYRPIFFAGKRARVSAHEGDHRPQGRKLPSARQCAYRRGHHSGLQVG